MPGHVLGPGLEPGPEPGLQRLKYGHVGDVFALALELRSSKETESRLPHEAARPHLQKFAILDYNQFFTTFKGKLTLLQVSGEKLLLLQLLQLVDDLLLLQLQKAGIDCRIYRSGQVTLRLRLVLRRLSLT